MKSKPVNINFRWAMLVGIYISDLATTPGSFIPTTIGLMFVAIISSTVIKTMNQLKRPSEYYEK